MPKTPAKRSSRRDKTPIGRRLREERIRLGLSQLEVGVAAGLDAEDVHTPNFIFVKQLAKVVGDAAYLYAEGEQLAGVIKSFCER